MAPECVEYLWRKCKKDLKNLKGFSYVQYLSKDSSTETFLVESMQNFLFLVDWSSIELSGRRRSVLQGDVL